MNLRATARQVLLWSLAAWAVALILAMGLLFVRAWPFAHAAAAGALFVGVVSIAYGAVGLGGGGVHMSPGPTQGQVRVDPRRERVPGGPGTLTPLGLALLIAPQLFIFAALIDP